MLLLNPYRYAGSGLGEGSILKDAIMALSPAAYWRMDDTSGSTLTDISGNSRNGTITGTPSYSVASLDPNSLNYSMSYTTTSMYARATHGTHFNGAYTFIALIKLNATAVAQGIFHKGDNNVTNNQGNYSYRDTANKAVTYWFASSSWRNVVSTRGIPDNTTILYVLTYNGTTTLTQYVGDPAPLVQTLSAAFVNNTQPLSLAINKSTSFVNTLNGTIDEIAWISSELTTAQVQVLFDTVSSLKTATTFNPEDVGASVTLSNGNNTASMSIVNYGASRGTNSHHAGKKFFSFVADAVTTNKWYGGVSEVKGSVTNVSPVRAGVWSYRNDGTVYPETGTPTGPYTAISATNKLSVAIDFDAGKGWFGVNDTWVNSGDPAAGTNATFTFTANTYLFPFWSSGSGTGTVTATLYCTSANGLTIPSGFSLWG